MNQQPIDLNTLSEQQLQQLLLNIESNIGKIELDKQMFLQTYFQVQNFLAQLQEKAKQMPVKMPTLKKITLPKSETVT